MSDFSWLNYTHLPVEKSGQSSSSSININCQRRRHNTRFIFSTHYGPINFV